MKKFQFSRMCRIWQFVFFCHTQKIILLPYFEIVLQWIEREEILKWENMSETVDNDIVNCLTK